MSKKIILTIDDAPSANLDEKLDLLDELGINAVWFVLGKNVEGRKASLLRAIKRGDILGNHSWTHPFYSQISVRVGKAEILQTEELLNSLYEEVGVERPAKIFRFPYGDPGAGKESKQLQRRKWSLKYHRLQKFLAQNDFVGPPREGIHLDPLSDSRFHDRDWFWSFDNEEWNIIFEYQTPIAQEERLMERLRMLENRPGTDLLLMHDHDNTSVLFDLALRYMAHQKFEFILPILK